MRSKLKIIFLGISVSATLARGQQDPTQLPASTTTQPQSPAPAFGQEPPAPQVTLAPPVTSLDQMSLEPTISPRSFLQPGAHLTESVNSNLGQGGGVVGITRLLGSVDLTRIWSRYTFLADYVGGAAFYSDAWGKPSQIHEVDAAQRYAWRTGQLQVRDSLTYLPEGSFGFSGFNGAGGGGLAGEGAGGGFGGVSSFGSLGQQPRLTNGVTMDARESFSPRSSITAAAGYTFTDFLHPNSSVGTINSRQESAQVGYSRVLNHFDQLGLQYVFEQFQFPIANAGKIDAQTVQALYEHAVSGRMQVILGVGPQWTTLHPQFSGTTTKLNVNVHAIVRYRFSREGLSLSYNRHTTAGSGIQLGSTTDDARATLSRQLTRQWTGTLDGGYSRHTALLPPVTNSLGGSYQTGFGGGGLSRRLGRFFSLQMHYQYTYELFNHTNPQIASGQNFNRHIGDITLSWRPAPIRLD
jgi:hypothetical protein